MKKIGRAISAGESFGSSIHNTLKRWGELELKHNPLPAEAKKQLIMFDEEPADEHKDDLTLNTLLSLWRTCFIAEGYGSRAEMDAKFGDGEQALRHFFRWWQEKPRTVAGIEKSFKLSIPGTKDAVLSGRLDRVERTENGLAIIDFKSTNPRHPKDLEADLQLSLYALAAKDIWNEPVASLSLLCLSEDGAVEQMTTRSDGQLHDALTGIRLLAERMEQEDFTPAPSVQICRHCPYRDICPARAV